MAQYSGITEADFQAALDAKADKVHQHAHGSLSGLTDDHHPQYLNNTRGDARYYLKATVDTAIAAKADAGHQHTFEDLTDVAASAPEDGQVWAYSTTLGSWRPATLSGGGGTTDHGALTGLADDDHPQYLNQTRGDVRYYLKAQLYTKTEVDTALAGKADAGHTHALNALSDVDVSDVADGQALTFTAGQGWRPATINTGGGVTDHGALEGLGDDDHPHYLNSTRGDARYYQKAEVDAAVAAKADPVSRVRIAANHAAVAEQIIAVDTDAAAVTITAPANPAAGAYFFVGDAGGNAATNNITIDFGAETFAGSDQDFIVNVNNFGSGFLFDGGEWELFG